MDVAASGGQIDFFGISDWNCDATTAICTLPTPLQPIQQFPSTFTVNISYDQPGRKTLTAMVTATGGPGDPNLNNNSDTDFVDVIAATDELFADGFED